MAQHGDATIAPSGPSGQPLPGPWGVSRSGRNSAAGDKGSPRPEQMHRGLSTVGKGKITKIGIEETVRPALFAHEGDGTCSVPSQPQLGCAEPRVRGD